MRDFRMFSDKTSAPGTITVQALEKALKTFCTDKVGLDDIMKLIQNLEPNSKGVINYAEVIQLAGLPSGVDPKPAVRDKVEAVKGAKQAKEADLANSRNTAVAAMLK